MTLIAFPMDRASRQGDERTCSCGSTWFRLERTNLEGIRTGGVVTITHDGRIVGYSGELICNDCGEHQ
ncbi:hypothetical protein [Microbacterium sp. No. 7]|uniref:hypothetical protein n=1 Tax=Microbacterium sp. No. 7 TaxID=1714373 RepID=UPI0006D1E7C0|nr:hypothetical protein [Microbacterium sp. No. 7]ALJ22022.1 hypothetical protein AOA12_19860 [Microbacterium sp. No. 7]